VSATVLEEVALQTRRVRRTDRRRDAITLSCLAIVVAGLVMMTLTLGDITVAPGDVVRVLLGENVPGASFVIGDLRLPRALGSLLAGAAFGMSGALFQTLLRNALASPDLIGINAGASAAAVVAIGFFGASGLTVFVAAVVGAIVTVATVWACAYRKGLAPLRFVLVGIAIGAALQAVIAYVLTRTGVNQAQDAVVWVTGSLNRSLWDQLTPGAVVLAVLIPAALVAARSLPVLRLGDDTAAALGTHPTRAKAAMVLIAVALASVGTAITGPLAFVAFLACPIASRWVRRPASLLPAAALTGAAIVLAADRIGQLALGTTVPAGVVTGAIGAPCLLWLLMRGRTRV